jgi:hypothetical protein
MPRSAAPPTVGKITSQGRDLILTAPNIDCPPEDIYPPTFIPLFAKLPAKTRRTKVASTPYPSIGKSHVGQRSEKAPDIKVFDAMRLVDEVQGGSLTKSD